MNFWDSKVWSFLFVISVLLIALLVGNIIKKNIPFMRDSLIPTSVIGGVLLVFVALIYKWIWGEVMFDTAIFGYNGTDTLEMITYHTLALGFIASTLKTTKKKLTKKRGAEVFNTGVTTVATYLLQGVFGIAITLIAALFITGVFPASGMLLPFGYGQGSGQAMNYGSIYQNDFGFIGGKSFGLAIAALGFISASIGGVIHLNIMKHRGKFKPRGDKDRLNSEEIESEGEIPMQESIDKMTIQIALIFLVYAFTYISMYLLSRVIPSMRATIFGFNFLLGVIMALLLKLLLNKMHKWNIVKKEYANNFLLTRISNFFFDIMVIAGISAIRIETIMNYFWLLMILGAVGLLVTYLYNRIVAKALFKDYQQEQFLVMFGMLTGTASTGIILLRELDADFETPAADNLVYQNLPAIVLGFPVLMLANIAPISPYLVLGLMALFFVILNIVLFRSFIFKKRKKKK